MQIMLDSYRQYIFCFEGNEDGGYVMACGMNVPTDVKGTEYIQQAYVFERNLTKYHFKTFHKIFVNIFD